METDNQQLPHDIPAEDEEELEKFVLSLLEDQPVAATRGPLDLLANVLAVSPTATVTDAAPAQAGTGAVDESRLDLVDLLDSPDVVSNLAKLLSEKLKIPSIVAVPMAEYILKSLKKKKTTRRKPRKTTSSTAKKKKTAAKKQAATAKKPAATAKKPAATAKKPAATAKKKTTAKKTAAKKPAAKKKTSSSTTQKKTTRKKASSAKSQTTTTNVVDS